MLYSEWSLDFLEVQELKRMKEPGSRQLDLSYVTTLDLKLILFELILCNTFLNIDEKLIVRCTYIAQILL